MQSLQAPTITAPKWLKLVVSACVIFYFGITILWWLPGFYFRDHVLNKLTPPLMFMGVWQDYGVFVPNPRGRNFHLDATVLMQDGSVAIWTFPRVDKMNFFDSMQKERYRKFGYDHLVFDHDKIMWVDFCAFLARQYEPCHPVAIMLTRHFADIPKPQNGNRLDLPAHSKEMTYYVYPMVLPKEEEADAKDKSQAKDKDKDKEKESGGKDATMQQKSDKDQAKGPESKHADDEDDSRDF